MVLTDTARKMSQIPAWERLPARRSFVSFLRQAVDASTGFPHAPPGFTVLRRLRQLRFSAGNSGLRAMVAAGLAGIAFARPGPC